MSNTYIDAAVSNRIENLDKKIDKLLSLIDDIKSGKQHENLMGWRVAALKKLERTQKQINELIKLIERFKKGLIIKENVEIKDTLTFINNGLPATLDEYEQSHTLHLDYIIKHLIDIRNNIFKE